MLRLQIKDHPFISNYAAEHELAEYKFLFMRFCIKLQIAIEKITWA